MNNRPMRNDKWKALIVFWLLLVTVAIVTVAGVVGDRLAKLENNVVYNVGSVIDAESDLIAQGWSKECMRYDLDINSDTICVKYIYVRWDNG
jgi:hypothetical protein